MNPDSTNWFQWLLAAFVGVLSWLAKMTHQKATAAVSREEFQASMKTMQDERRAMHEENKETLSRIHSRVDELYRSSNFRRD